MTTAQKTTGVVVIAIAIIATALAMFFWETNISGATSPQGSTFGSAKTAGVAINLATPGANATSTSILNTDANDRYVREWHVACENVGTSQTAYTGAGLASLQITVATSSTAAPATLVGFADVAKSVALSTSTVNLLVSSSTLQTATSSLAMVWPANTYMTFFFNATNTALCTVGVDYFAS